MTGAETESPGADIRLRRAERSECAALSDLCRRSKAMWGYDDAFMQRCGDELTVRPAGIGADLIRVAVTGDGIVGVAELSVDGAEAEVEKLFVKPVASGTGAGRMLMEWMVEAARDAGATRLIIDSDPNAVGFYKRLGAVGAGSVPSASIPGRRLPRLQIDLTGSQQDLLSRS